MSTDQPSWDHLEQDLETLREDILSVKRRDPDELDEDDRRRLTKLTILVSDELKALSRELTLPREEA